MKKNYKFNKILEKKEIKSIYKQGILSHPVTVGIIISIFSVGILGSIGHFFKSQSKCYLDAQIIISRERKLKQEMNWRTNVMILSPHMKGDIKIKNRSIFSEFKEFTFNQIFIELSIMAETNLKNQDQIKEYKKFLYSPKNLIALEFYSAIELDEISKEEIKSIDSDIVKKMLYENEYKPKEYQFVESCSSRSIFNPSSYYNMQSVVAKQQNGVYF